MRISLSQISSDVGDFVGNYQKIMDALKYAAKEDCTMAVFPELSLCGYLHRDSIEQVEFQTKTNYYLERITQNTPPDIYAVVGTPMPDAARPNCWHNAVAVIHNNRIIHRQAKTLLPNYDIFDEKRYYTPALHWNTFTVQERVCGIAICEDIWWAEDASLERLARDGFGPCALPLESIDLLVICSASPYEPEKLQRRTSLVQRCCSVFDFDAVYVNTVGADDGVLFDGQSFAIERTGKIMHISPMYKDTLDIVSLHTDRHTPLASPSVTRTHDPHSERYRSLVFGLREYARKNNFSRAVLGVSGGIDSAVTAVIARDALGATNTHALLMPSPYSSNASITDATALVEELALSYAIMPIMEIFSAYRALLQQHEYPTKYDIDITEQNIQARIRGMLIMAHANATNAIALTTGNKSELAVGYCTQYGDMVGALAVIGDLYKSEVYQLAQYINRDAKIIPASIITKPPSAELKPNQVDQDTLPSYHILDRVLRMYIEERASLKQIIESGIEEKIARSIISMHNKSEYKRAQTAPVIRVSKKAFGIGRRMLISKTPFE